MNQENEQKNGAKPAPTLKGRHIGIWLDVYDDIFSDFDPRPFSSRNISDDFISELNKLYREDAEGVAEIQLLLPKEKRNVTDETIIIRRIHSYFRKKHEEALKKRSRIIRNGWLFTVAGIIILFVAGLITTIDPHRLWRNMMLVIFEPAGWFFSWTGLDLLVFTRRHQLPPIGFYARMMKCRIVFLPIETTQ